VTAPDPGSAGARDGKYARVERERRFLLTQPPPAAAMVRVVKITDRYLTGTRLRLRRMRHADSGACEYKFTQKIPADRPSPAQGLITNTYLDQDEYDLLATLPALVLSKTRLSVPPMGIDVFDGPLAGLVLAEAEFTTDAEAVGFVPPSYCLAEVTTDPRFTGGRLVSATQDELRSWLAEYGIAPTTRA
jgi:CYTH domain-containing protein